MKIIALDWGRQPPPTANLQGIAMGGDRLRVGRGTTRADDAQGTPTQSHTSPSILVYEEKKRSPRFPLRSSATARSVPRAERAMQTTLACKVMHPSLVNETLMAFVHPSARLGNSLWGAPPVGVVTGPDVSSHLQRLTSRLIFTGVTLTSRLIFLAGV